MEDFTIEIKVKAINSGAAKDLILRQLMSEVEYCEIETFNIYNSKGEDVTDEIETHPYYCEEVINCGY